MMRFRDWVVEDGFPMMTVWFIMGWALVHSYLRGDENVLPVTAFAWVFIVFLTWSKYQRDKKWAERKAKEDEMWEEKRAEIYAMIEECECECEQCRKKD